MLRRLALLTAAVVALVRPAPAAAQAITYRFDGTLATADGPRALAFTFSGDAGDVEPTDPGVQPSGVRNFPLTASIAWAPAGSFGFTTGLALNLTELGDPQPFLPALGLYFGNTVLGGATLSAVLLDPFFLTYDLRTSVAPRAVAIEAQFGIDQPLLTGSGTFSVVGGADLPTTGVVPEPSTYVLLATGLGALAAVRRRRGAR